MSARRLLKVFWLVLCGLVLWACSDKSRFHKRSFESPQSVTIQRFDRAFLQLDSAQMVEGLQALRKQFPTFYPFFLREALLMNPDSVHANAALIRQFLLHPQFQAVHNQHLTVMNDVSEYEQQLSEAYSYLNYYFPEIYLPEVYFFASGFNQHFLMTDSMVGVGADLYLGSDFEPYQHLTHDYIVQQMIPQRLVPELMHEILKRHFLFTHEVNLLNSMIYEGKLMFLKQVILPEVSTEHLMGYHQQEVEWIRTFSKAAWKTMLENRDLFSTDRLLISQYVGVAPFTSPVSQESPGRLGVWFGWQIVQSFMDNNPQVTLPQLMNELSPRTIFEQSGFRP